MKKISRYLAALLIVTVCPVFAAEVTNIEFSYKDGATIARIAVNGTVRFTHQTEIPKNGRPDRIIIDVLAATHELGAKEFLNLPDCPVSGIRSSQFSVTPEKIVRLVFDLKSVPIYRIESDTRSISVIFSSKKITPFATWSTSRAKNVSPKPVSITNLKTKSASKKANLAKVEPNTNEKAARQNKKINQDRLASLSTNKTTVASKTSVKKSTVAKKPFAVKSTNSKKSSAAATSKNATLAINKVSKKNPAIVNVTGPVEPSMSNDQNKKAGSWPKIDVKSVVASADKSQAKSNVKIASKNASKENNKPAKVATIVQSKKAVPSIQKKSSVSASSKSVVANKKSAKKSSSKVVASSPTKKSSKKIVAKSPTKKSSGKAVTKTVVLKTSKKKSNTKVATVNKKYTKKKTTKKKTIASASTKKSKSGTSRFRRSASSLKLKRTMVAQFPKRLVIKYKHRGRRDPFASLLDDTRTYNSPIEQRIPNVEGTKLVGIIESNSEANRALLEDKDGYGYILKSGDKVRNGYVLRVEKDRVYFQIFEYGWSRTIALSIHE